MTVVANQLESQESEGCLPKGISTIHLDVEIINQEGPSYVVLNGMEKGLGVWRSCCIPLTKHLVEKVESVDSPMRTALGMYFVNN